MSEPYFPAPPKKEPSTPYRAPQVVARAEASAPEPARESFLSIFLWRFAVRVVALGITIGLLYALVWMGDGGAKWPQAIMIVLGLASIVLLPVIVFARIRRLARFLFARHQDD